MIISPELYEMFFDPYTASEIVKQDMRSAKKHKTEGSEKTKERRRKRKKRKKKGKS